MTEIKITCQHVGHSDAPPPLKIQKWIYEINM